MAHNSWAGVSEAMKSCRVENLTSSWVVVAHAGGRQKPEDHKVSLVDRPRRVSDSQGNTDKACLENPNKQTKLTSETLVPGAPPRPHHPLKNI